MAELLDYLKRAVEDEASDLFIVAGGKVSEKVEKNLVPISEEVVYPQETERLIRELYSRAKRPIENYISAEMMIFRCPCPDLPVSGSTPTIREVPWRPW